MSDETKAPEVARVWHTQVLRGGGLAQTFYERTRELAETAAAWYPNQFVRAITVVEQPSREALEALLREYGNCHRSYGVAAALGDPQEVENHSHAAATARAAILRLLGYDA